MGKKREGGEEESLSLIEFRRVEGGGWEEGEEATNEEGSHTGNMRVVGLTTDVP